MASTPFHCPWVSTVRAAAHLGINRSTLQRRIHCDHWRQGVHYRWVRKFSRPVLQFHLTRIEELLQARGW
ncbi:MAG: hypothetical protein VKI42_06160 [Synechococcaceae cyanobacterium]|nr:hypothetical protein [Synechococcaceae cyanobacterium]